MARFFSIAFTSIILFTSPLYAEENLDPSSASTDVQNVSYVTDKLFIYVHAGPGRQYRITGSLVAGSEFNVLQQNEDKKYTQIEDPRGRKGWVETQYITATPGLSVQLKQLQQQLTHKDSSVSEVNHALEEAQQALINAHEQSALLNEELVRLEQSLVQKEHTINTLNEETENQDLKEKLEWLMKGGGVLFAGIVLGYILAFVPKPKRKNNFGYGDL